MGRERPVEGNPGPHSSGVQTSARGTLGSVSPSPGRNPPHFTALWATQGLGDRPPSFRPGCDSLGAQPRSVPRPGPWGTGVVESLSAGRGGGLSAGRPPRPLLREVGGAQVAGPPFPSFLGRRCSGLTGPHPRGMGGPGKDIETGGPPRGLGEAPRGPREKLEEGGEDACHAGGAWAGPRGTGVPDQAQVRTGGLRVSARRCVKPWGVARVPACSLLFQRLLR